MELLLEIKDKEIPAEISYKTREASRAVLFDDHNLVPLLFVANEQYHKIPGGGIDDGEDQKQALIREVLEETGSAIEITDEVGKIVEFRSKFNLLQTSYCYLGKITTKGQPEFTEDEVSHGFQLVWLSLDEAIKTITNDKPTDYEGSFIQKRDLRFLQKAKELINGN
ncbi:MAG: NUDIX domain-containing protein [bacterium]|nr:NUDIX domain-containing protein [bacterium]